jgi:hypothetical protein
MIATPVALLVFNRPLHTTRVLARIREARPRTLFVIADGPRDGVPEDRVRCSDVRRIVEEGVDWPCELVKIYSDTNLGCGTRVSSGLNAVFNSVESAIILEDDCLPAPSFFLFCEELLRRYADNERVGQVAGCSFLKGKSSWHRESYYFSRYPHCWGWATWRRAWRRYDHQMTDWHPEMPSNFWPKGLNDPKERRRWRTSFVSVLEGKVDSWAYRWTYSLWRHNMLSANSRVNLVSNIGFGPEATHTRRGTFGGLSTEEAQFPLVHPSRVCADDLADTEVSRMVFRPIGKIARIAQAFRRLHS